MPLQKKKRPQMDVFFCLYICTFGFFFVPLHPKWVHMANKRNIAKAESASLQPLENIENLIHVIRGKQVMLDRDLARLYGVETRVLNQAVQRNKERFPEDFMFQLSLKEMRETPENKEVTDLTSQIVISNKRGGQRYMPYAFTEKMIKPME